MNDTTSSQKDEFIPYNDFAKLIIRVATIETAEDIPKSDKLLKLSIDIGNNEKRIIIAGIKKQYDKEQLINSQIIVLTNLEQRKVFGITSQGMLLACDVEGKAVLIRPDSPVPNGTKIR
ncbi:MAG: methionine--tRNA ligase subunit beta [Candidatus Thorarchaeota archaeon]